MARHESLGLWCSNKTCTCGDGARRGNPYFLPCHPYSPWPGTNPWDYGVQTKHAHAETGRGGGTELLLAQSLGPNPPFTEGPATSDEIPFKSMVEEDEAGCTQS